MKQPTLIEQEIAEFDKKYPELFSSCDGREGYDAEVSQDIKQYLRTFASRIVEETKREGLEEYKTLLLARIPSDEIMDRIKEEGTGKTYYYNRALYDIKAAIWEIYWDKREEIRQQDIKNNIV